MPPPKNTVCDRQVDVAEHAARKRQFGDCIARVGRLTRAAAELGGRVGVEVAVTATSRAVRHVDVDAERPRPDSSQDVGGQGPVRRLRVAVRQCRWHGHILRTVAHDDLRFAPKWVVQLARRESTIKVCPRRRQLVFWLALWLMATVAICVLALLPVNRVALHVKLAEARRPRLASTLAATSPARWAPDRGPRRKPAPDPAMARCICRVSTDARQSHQGDRRDQRL